MKLIADRPKGRLIAEGADAVKPFPTTLGCLRLASPSDAEALARLIQAAWNRGEQVKLEVI